MVDEDFFVIDATFLLDDAEKAFLGSAPLVDESGRNTSVIYGAVSGLLRLRRILGIKLGIMVIGADAYDVSSVTNVELFREFLPHIGANVLHEPNVPIRSLCRSILLGTKGKFWVVTREKSLMQLINSQCKIILPSEGACPELITEHILESEYRIRPGQVPSFLALTEDDSADSLTNKQATRLLEVFATLTAAFEGFTTDPLSPKTRRYLAANKAKLLARLQELTVSDHGDDRRVVPLNTILRSDEDSRMAFRHYGFPSLWRLMELPEKVTLPGGAEDRKHSYIAVVDQVGLHELMEVVASTDICAVDTESTDKDPRKASLLGVALAIGKGRAFYVPITEADLHDVSPASVIDVLRRLLEGQVKVVGHNLKYDYVLLSRYGIRIQFAYFDTMLAAHECFGDWDFFNLGAVAKKLIRLDVKRYKDIATEGQSPQDIPFQDLVEHGCTDADATLRLYAPLRKILEEKGIDEQFANEVMPLMRLLGDKELDGVLVDIHSILRAKDAVADEIERARTSIFAIAGKQFDVDSMQDITTVFLATEGLQERMARQPLRQGQIEELAQGHVLARAIVHYRRLKQQIRQLEAICKAERNGKVFPLFSQVKASHGSISSSDPNLFTPDGCLPRGAVLDTDIRQRMPDESRALDILQQLTGDRFLEIDRRSGNSEFIGGQQPALAGLSHADVLISLAIGVSNAALCKKFLIDAPKARALRDGVLDRYPTLFTWLYDYRRTIAYSGFVSSGRRRKYLEGLRSSDIDKRNRALRNAVRWLIGM